MAAAKRARRSSPEAGGSLPDLIADLAKSGRLTQRESRAAFQLVKDIRSSGGCSGSLGCRYGERISSGTGGGKLDFGRPVGPTDADVRLQFVLDGLSEGDREVFKFLVVNGELARPKLADFGASRAGYKPGSDTAAGYAVGRVAAMLDHIADGYDAFHAKHAPKPVVWSGNRLDRIAHAEELAPIEKLKRLQGELAAVAGHESEIARLKPVVAVIHGGKSFKEASAEIEIHDPVP